MEINYQTLGKEMVAAGLTGKAVSDYTKEEVAALVRAVYAACPPRPFMDELRDVFLDKGVDTQTFYRFFNEAEPPF